MRQEVEQGIFKIGTKHYEVTGEAGYKVDGSRSRFKRRVRGTLADARRVRATLYQPADSPQNTDITLNAFFDRFCDLHGKQVLRVTVDTYKAQYNAYLRKTLGSKPIGKITVVDCERVIYAAPSPAMHRKVYGLLRLLFNRAKAWGMIANSPVASIAPPKVPTKRTQRKCNTTEELKEIMKLINGEWFAPIIYVMVGSGARLSEACGLDGASIDRDNCLITINQTYRRVSEGVYELSSDMKTDRSERVVKVSHEIIERLPVTQGALVTLDGRRANGKQVYHAYKRFIDTTDIPYYPVKNFRHAFATEMLDNDKSTADVAYAMGHTNSYITDTYLDLEKRAGKVNSDVVGAALF